MSSDASLATSVPIFPIATPMSARLSAGASFTPSPVTATTSPCCFSKFTMRSLSSGSTREKMRASSSLMTAANSSSSIPLSSLPVITGETLPDSDNPISCPTAWAVIAWSPVMMNVLIPAVWHWVIASCTPSRGGSVIPTRPKKVTSLSTSSIT